MSDGHPQGVRNEELNNAKRWFSIAFVILLAAILLFFRNEVAGWLAYSFSYMVWSLNFFGRIIPPQGIWIGLMILIVYIAVGSFYGKSFSVEKDFEAPTPARGPVEAMAEWIEEKDRGVFFKWRIAHLLGKVHEAQLKNTSGRMDAPPKAIEEFFDAGLNHSYVDFPTPGMFRKYEPTALDAELESVLDYLEDQMEIHR